MKIGKDTAIVFSNIPTGRCNCNCRYCHYFDKVSREDVNRDINPKLFDRYVDFVKYVQGIAGKVSFRFSGGEPLTMGEKLFQYTDLVHERTGLDPYIMTNGLALNEEVIRNASKHHVSSFVVSIENPLHSENDLVPYHHVIELVRSHKDTSPRVYFGMMVIENEYFSKIGEIADLFWSDCEEIPPMCEVNYGPFRPPTEEQINDLRNSVSYIVNRYHNRCPLYLFPYIIPEFYPCNRDSQEYLIELSLDDNLGLMDMTNEEALNVIESRLDKSYFKYDCRKECMWKENCQKLKWVWRTNDHEQYSRIESYCNMKCALSEAYLSGLGLKP